MKRIGNLYKNTYRLENIMQAFDEVCRNTKNKKKVNHFKDFRCLYIFRIYNILNNRQYTVGPYNSFTIYEPKKREIVSQGMQDKIINHIVSRCILHPAILPCLLDVNVASRENLGTQKGLSLFYDYQRICDLKYDSYYILKCDIKHFFASIDHCRLKDKLRKRIKDKEALKIVFDIIDSHKDGLGIGNMSSQILAIFYLNDLDHYIKENLKIKYYVRYQDDFLLFHQSKNYLKKCLNDIQSFLKDEKLELNHKSRIYKNTNGFIFLGRNNNGKYCRYRTIKRRLKKRRYLYDNGVISIASLASSITSYKYLFKKVAK